MIIVTGMAFSILNPLAIEMAVVKRQREYPAESSITTWAVTKLSGIKRVLHMTQMVGSASDGRMA